MRADIVEKARLAVVDVTHDLSLIHISAQRALFIARIVERFGVDHAAVAVERAPEQIVGGNVVKIACLFDKRKPRLADPIFIKIGRAHV